MPTVAFNKFQSFVEQVAEKGHDLDTDQIKIALTNTAPSASAAVLADLTEISYTNLSSRNVTTTSGLQTGGLYKLILANLTLTATGGSVGPFRYLVLYNDTSATDLLIGYFDYGSSLTITDGDDLNVLFDQTNGVLTVQ